MTITLTPPAGTSGAVRILRAPRAEPPFDDERPPPSRPEEQQWPGEGQRPGEQEWSSERPWPGDGQWSGERQWPDAPAWPELPLQWRSDEQAAPACPEPRRPRTAGPSPAELAALRFVTVCREILGGFRPARHLQVLVAAEEFEAISGQLLRPRRHRIPGPTGETPAQRGWVARTTGGRWPQSAGTGATGAPVPGLRSGTDPVEVRHQRVTEPCDGVAEAVAILARGDEVWAMAIRLERRPAGWLCTFLQVL